MLANTATMSHRNGDMPSGRWMIDPLDDGETGGSSLVSDVEMLRIVLVALETGARFQRDGLSLDPLAWMVTPRRMFGGLPPIEACVRMEACSKAVLVHGLGLGLDADAAAIDLLLCDDDIELCAVSA